MKVSEFLRYVVYGVSKERPQDVYICAKIDGDITRYLANKDVEIRRYSITEYSMRRELIHGLHSLLSAAIEGLSEERLAKIYDQTVDEHFPIIVKVRSDIYNATKKKSPMFAKLLMRGLVNNVSIFDAAKMSLLEAVMKYADAKEVPTPEMIMTKIRQVEEEFGKFAFYKNDFGKATLGQKLKRLCMAWGIGEQKEIVSVIVNEYAKAFNLS